MLLLYGEEPYLVHRALKTEIEKSGMIPTYFDEQDSLEKILMEITTISMFYDRKLLVIKNHSCLVRDDGGVDKLIEELKRIDPSVKMIFVWDGKLPISSHLVTHLSKVGSLREYKRTEQKDIVHLVKEIVISKGGSISPGVAIKLAGKLPNDLTTIIREIDKLLLESSVVNEEMVENSIGDYAKDDFFAISNALVEQNAISLVRAYRDRLRNGDEPRLIIHQIAKTLVEAMEVNAFREQGFSSKETSEKTKIHVFRVRKALELLDKSNTQYIRSLISSLTKLDLEIKTGKISEQIALDVFILRMI